MGHLGDAYIRPESALWETQDGHVGIREGFREFDEPFDWKSLSKSLVAASDIAG